MVTTDLETAVLLSPDGSDPLQLDTVEDRTIQYNGWGRQIALAFVAMITLATGLATLTQRDGHAHAPLSQAFASDQDGHAFVPISRANPGVSTFACNGSAALLRPDSGDQLTWKCKGPPGLCIEAAAVCDGVATCPDGSDEKNCRAKSEHPNPAASSVPAAGTTPAQEIVIPAQAPVAPAQKPVSVIPAQTPVAPAQKPVSVIPAQTPVAPAQEPVSAKANGATDSLLSGPMVPVPSDGGDPNWGCGLLGDIPGITQDGEVTKETQMLLDALKKSSTFNKVSFWNWNLAPMTSESFGSEHHEYLSKDIIFMPDQWGAQVVDAKQLRPAGQPNFLDSSGKPSPAEMATILLGSNEPDIAGSCMGNLFGTCSKPCSDQSVAAGDCPAAHLEKDRPIEKANSKGECNCWQFSHATGVGFWPLEGCEGTQPLPHLWNNSQCVDTVMKDWKKTAAIATKKGYKYLSTPMVAVDIDYTQKFIERACGCNKYGKCSCTKASCGCPVYVAFHFYGYDCQPEATGGYTDFQKRLDGVKHIMEKYTFVKGAIINEVGMLNCAPVSKDPICIPNSGDYPASSVADNSCAANRELPDGLATFIAGIFDRVIAARTKDGRAVVKGLSWFNSNMDGGTYNLRLFDKDGSVNKVGRAYMKGCTKWGAAQ